MDHAKKDSVFNPVNLRRAVAVAAVVGPVLTLINQHEAIFSGQPPDWLKVALTFCVPFGVSLFSSWRASKAAATPRGE